MKPSRSLWIRSPRTSDSAVHAAGPRPRVSLGACPEFGFSEAVWPHHDQLDQFMHLSKHRHLNNNKVSLTRCLALYTLAYFLCQLQQSFKLKLPYLHLATSEMWCWSGGRGILKKKLSLCYSNVYYCNGAQKYEQFLQVNWLYQTLILIGVASCL